MGGMHALATRYKGWARFEPRAEYRNSVKKKHMIKAKKKTAEFEIATNSICRGDRDDMMGNDDDSRFQAKRS